MYSFFLIGIGGALGAMLRHGVNIGAGRIFGLNFPYGTIIVNVIGSFLMGVLIAYLARRLGASNHELRLFLATGFLGGFTTFSAFSLDAVALYERGDITQAGVYVVMSVLVSIGALFAGLLLMRSLG